MCWAYDNFFIFLCLGSHYRIIEIKYDFNYYALQNYDSLDPSLARNKVGKEPTTRPDAVKQLQQLAARKATAVYDTTLPIILLASQQREIMTACRSDINIIINVLETSIPSLPTKLQTPTNMKLQY